MRKRNKEKRQALACRFCMFSQKSGNPHIEVVSVKIAGRILALLLTAVMLTGCGRRQALAVVVERVDVVCAYGETTLLRSYSQSRKMTALLSYLQWLAPKHKADCDPAALPGDVYQLTLFLSDGGKTVYRQKTNGYLQKNDGPWESIDPEKGAVLHTLLEEMESD